MQKIIYTPWQKESYEKRLEIRYDGTSVTLMYENGTIIQDHTDLTEKP